MLWHAEVCCVDLAEMHPIPRSNDAIQKLKYEFAMRPGEETFDILEYEGIGPVVCDKFTEHRHQGVSFVVVPAQAC